MSSSISKSLLLLAGLFFLISGFHTQDLLETDVSEHDQEHEAPRLCQNMSTSIDDFAFDLYHQVSSLSQSTNILFSPVTIATAFAIVSLGTKGDTHKQILEGLKFNLTEMPEAHIHACFRHHLHTLHQSAHLSEADSFEALTEEIWFLRRRFMEEVQQMYHSDITFLDPTVNMITNRINNHVDQETRGEIMELMKDLEKDTGFALVNYLSFNGTWHNESCAEHTVEEDFQVDRNTTVKVPMSYCAGRFLLHWEPELSSWVMVHHYVDNITAFFILPDPGKMAHLETALNHRHLENILRSRHRRFARVYFPKLSISGTYDLKAILSEMGITRVFGSEADLSGDTGDAPLKLSKAVHKAVLTLDKKGTEAAENIDLNAVTLMSGRSTIRFIRPFLIVIRDPVTNATIFIGKIVDPTTQ